MVRPSVNRCISNVPSPRLSRSVRRAMKLIDDEILDFLVAIQKLRYLPCVDKIQSQFEKGIAQAYRKALS